MKERVFNIFAVDSQELPGIFREYKVLVHELEGNDDFKTRFLKYNAKWDLENAITFKVPKNFAINIFDENGSKALLEGHAKISAVQDESLPYMANIFNEAFVSLEGPEKPLYVLSVEINGKLLHLMNKEDQEEYLNSL